MISESYIHESSEIIANVQTCTNIMLQEIDVYLARKINGGFNLMGFL